MAFVGLDVGTSGCKGLLVSADGKTLASDHVEYQLGFQQPGWVVLDPDTVWNAVCSVLGHLGRAGSGNGDPVQGLAFSVSGDEAIPVDDRGRALYACVMSMDVRTAGLAESWERDGLSRELYEITGLPMAPNWPLLRLVWLREHEAEVFARTTRFLCWEDFLIFRLTGEMATDHSLASRTMAFDIHCRAWAPAILDRFELDRMLFPPVYPSAEMVGTVQPKLSTELGLKSDVRVVTGGFDQAMAALGAGLLHPGQVMVGTGTWEVVTVLTPSPALGPSLIAGGYATGCYVLPNLYYCLASNPGGGSLLRWFRDNFGREEIEVGRRTGLDPFELITRQAQDKPSGLLVLPHFAGSYTPWMDPESTGAILGLRLTTTRGDMIRGLLEGMTFELRENILRLEDAGIVVDELRATGGGARSAAWLQLKADVTGKTVTRVACEEAGCVAAAAIASAACGAYGSVADAIAQFVTLGETYLPRPAMHSAYDELFSTYHEMYASLRGLRVGDASRPTRYGDRAD
jgi:xylulokinase